MAVHAAPLQADNDRGVPAVTAEPDMIYCVEFEASSLLPGSFPIEVAWVDMNGQGENHLIRPTETWLDGSYGWSHQSEAVHGISLNTLMKEGKPPEWVARRAADVLSPRGVMACSDAQDFDGHWMDRLLDAGSERRSVRLLGVTQVYGWACRPLLDGLVALRGVERERGEQRIRPSQFQSAPEGGGRLPLTLMRSQSAWRTPRSRSARSRARGRTASPATLAVAVRHRLHPTLEAQEVRAIQAASAGFPWLRTLKQSW